jgi:hypothetical protein
MTEKYLTEKQINDVLDGSMPLTMANIDVLARAAVANYEAWLQEQLGPCPCGGCSLEPSDRCKAALLSQCGKWMLWQGRQEGYALGLKERETRWRGRSESGGIHGETLARNASGNSRRGSPPRECRGHEARHLH